MSNKNTKEGYLMGWALSGKGDTEIVIATLALEAGVITDHLFTSLIFMAIATTIISPIMLRYLVQKKYVKW